MCIKILCFLCFRFDMLSFAHLSHPAPFWPTPPFNFEFKIVKSVVKVQIEMSIGGNCKHNTGDVAELSSCTWEFNFPADYTMLPFRSRRARSR